MAIFPRVGCPRGTACACFVRHGFVAGRCPPACGWPRGPQVFEAAAFRNFEELVKFLYGDAVPDEAELQELGGLVATALSRVA